MLTLLELLQSHGRLSGLDLARRLEVDARTVRRYITILQDLGILRELAEEIYRRAESTPVEVVRAGK